MKSHTNTQQFQSKKFPIKSFCLEKRMQFETHAGSPAWAKKGCHLVTREVFSAPPQPLKMGSLPINQCVYNDTNALGWNCQRLLYLHRMYPCLPHPKTMGIYSSTLS